VHQQPPPLPDDVPAPVRALVIAALEKDPAKRPGQAGDFGRAALALRASLAAGSPETAVLPVVPANPPRSALAHGLLERGRSVRIASVLLAVVVIGVSARACLAPAGAVVPAVASGVTVEAATQLLADAQLDAIRTTETSKTVPAGRVIRTLPAPGDTVHEGDDITIVVSSGRPKVNVSSAAYVGRDADAVRMALQGLGLAPTFAYDGSGTPAGTVSSVTPTGSLTYGTSVTVHVVPALRKKHDQGEHND
jgi:serine/threonine-protein kinase